MLSGREAPVYCINMHSLSSNLQMRTAGSSETVVLIYQTTWCHTSGKTEIMMFAALRTLNLICFLSLSLFQYIKVKTMSTLLHYIVTCYMETRQMIIRFWI
jgi:hypothetical protein